MKNRLTDLNDILFAQIERLTDESLKPEQIDKEMQRAASVVQVADRIVNNQRLQLDGAKLIAAHGGDISNRLPVSMGLASGPPAKVTG